MAQNRLKALITEAQSGDMAAFARLLTEIERLGPSSLAAQELLNASDPAFRVGITGPPGAGKSTLISELLGELSSSGVGVQSRVQRSDGVQKSSDVCQPKIGVLAVDPSSPITHGAILGDRIRYSDHALKENIFIRSLGTRGSLGGLSASAYLMLRAFDICGFDLVLIETVGVGQVEVEIMNVADFVTVVLVPESGDSIQAMKAGIIEIADLFVVNKSDRPGAEALKREIEASVAMSAPVAESESESESLSSASSSDTTDSASSSRGVEVLLASALKREGLSQVAQAISSAQKNIDLKKNRSSVKRLREEAKCLMRASLEAEAARRVAKISNVEDMAKLFQG